MSNAVLLPLGVYLLSAALLYAETLVLGRALERIRDTASGFCRTLAICLLVLPLALVPLVPVVFLFTLEPTGKATAASLYYVAVLWLLGMLAVVPYWVHVARSPKKPRPTDRDDDAHPRHNRRKLRVVNESAAGDGLAGLKVERTDD